jgi:hypothetical protein
MSGQVTVETLPCVVCGKTSILEVDADALRMWQAGASIQVAMPHVPAPQREMLINGTHPACFDVLFPPDEPEEDDDEYIDEDTLHDRD